MDAQEMTTLRRLGELLRRHERRQHTDGSGTSSGPVLPDALFVLPAHLFHRLTVLFEKMAETSLDDSTLFEEETLLHLEFLKIYILSTPSLLLEGVAGPTSAPPLDVSLLSSCHALHLHRLPLESILGLPSLSGQLGSLHIQHCRRVRLGRVLLHCLSDQVIECETWPQLTVLSVTHTDLRVIDYDVFSSVPHLRRLDLSFNKLSSCPGLDGLPRLNRLALNFNSLTSVPTLCPSASLHTLLLRHNKLETLAGIEHLRSLVELDVAWNLLLHHDSLAPISLLYKLHSLHTEGNPFTAHREHRSNALSWVNASVKVGKFKLDGIGLVTREFDMIGLSRMVMSPPRIPSLITSSTEGPSSAHFMISREGSVVSDLTAASGAIRKKPRRAKKREAEIGQPECERDETSKPGVQLEDKSQFDSV